MGPQIVQPAGLGTVSVGSSNPGFGDRRIGSVAFNPSDPDANRQGDVISGSQVIGGANNQTYTAAQIGLTNGNL